MTEPRIHIHVWEHSEEHDDYNLRFDSELEWTGTYDDHIQFSGPGFGSKIHYEIRVWFKDLDWLIAERERFNARKLESVDEPIGPGDAKARGWEDEVG